MMDVDQNLSHDLHTTDKNHAQIIVYKDNDVSYTSGVAKLMDETVLYVDVEGVNIGNSGLISLVQVSKTYFRNFFYSSFII